jgi:hypothetical protein
MSQAHMNVLNSLKGGRKRKRSMRKMRRSKRYQNHNQNQNQNQNQNGGFIPGIGEVITQAIVPFGLYAAQHKFKSGSRGKQPSNYSLKKFKKFKFTRRV